jgi:flagellar biosynthesis/type III secretory pathway chaperone
MKESLRRHIDDLIDRNYKSYYALPKPLKQELTAAYMRAHENEELDCITQNSEELMSILRASMCHEIALLDLRFANSVKDHAIKYFEKQLYEAYEDRASIKDVNNSGGLYVKPFTI